VKVFQELKTLGQPGKDGELAMEGALPEEEVKDGHVLGPAGLPIGVGHRDLIQV
jgi:hypothetical protein